MELKRSIDDYYWETYVWYRGETISNQGEAMPHGKGTSYTKEGDKIYEGMWSNGVPSGPGRLYSRIDCYQYNQISFCDGLFDDGRISSGKGYDGQGNLVYEGGLRGDYINNNIMRSGIGSSYEDNKLSYSGNWNNDFPNGPGQLYFEGRLVYDGSFKGGSKHGKGKLYHPNGRVCYDGSWDADGKHGYGKLFNTSGNLLYEGEWRGNVQRPDIEPIGQRVIPYDCDIPFSQGKGFSIGKYQRNAILPTPFNWSYYTFFCGPNNPQIEWTCSLKRTDDYKGTVDCYMTIDEHGIVYVREADALRAYDTAGNEKWELAQRFETPCIISEDGTLYVVAADSATNSAYLYAIDSDGLEKWRKRCADSMLVNGPVINSNGTICIYDWQNCKLNAFTKNGTQFWQVQLPKEWFNSPPLVIDNNDNVYIKGQSSLYCIDPTGKINWSFDFPTFSFPCVMSPTFDSCGNIYAPDNSGSYIYSIAPDGTKRWQYALNSEIADGSILLVTPEDLVIVTLKNGFLIFNTDGETVGRYELEEDEKMFVGNAIMDSSGKVYITSHDDYEPILYCFNIYANVVNNFNDIMPSITQWPQLSLGPNKSLYMIIGDFLIKYKDA